MSTARSDPSCPELGGKQVRLRRDAARSRWLEQEGYRVLRFPTTEVHGNLDGVIAIITMELAAMARARPDTPTSPRPE